MIVSAHQPAYLPWLGYFEKIARADVFVYLDTVQFEKNSFINRNKIKTPQGPLWLTIPVKMKGHISSTLRETLIDDGQPWRAKHLKSIEMNYRKAPHFARNFPKFEALLGHTESNLAELCWRHLAFWLAEFGIATRVVRLSDMPVTGKKSDLVLDVCRQLEADYYVSGALGRGYLDEAQFAAAGIMIEYQEFQHPVYPQLWGGFEPYMGVIDYWMNSGSDFSPFMQRSSHGIQS